MVPGGLLVGAFSEFSSWLHGLGWGQNVESYVNFHIILFSCIIFGLLYRFLEA